MSKINLNFSFSKTVSPPQFHSQSTSCVSLPKGLTSSQLNLNNTSRFQQKKVLRKLHEQQVLNRISSTLKRFEENDKLLRQALKFRPIAVKKNKRQKQN